MADPRSGQTRRGIGVREAGTGGRRAVHAELLAAGIGFAEEVARRVGLRRLFVNRSIGPTVGGSLAPPLQVESVDRVATAIARLGGWGVGWNDLAVRARSVERQQPVAACQEQRDDEPR